MFSVGLHGKIDFKVFFVLFWVCCCSSAAASGVCREHIFYRQDAKRAKFQKVFLSAFALKSLNAIREDRTPNLLLIPSFMFPESAVIKRPPLLSTARRAGRVGCNIALNRVPAEARIWLVTTVQSRAGVSPARQARQREPFVGSADGGRRDACPTLIATPEEVRAQYKRVKPLKDISVTQRGWTLDVLNVVAAVCDRRKYSGAHRAPLQSWKEFTTADVYAFENGLVLSIDTSGC